jgi:hypothetical protein
MDEKRHREREHEPTWSDEFVATGNGPFGGARRLFLSVPGVQPQATKRNVLVVLSYLFVFGLLLALLGSAGVELLPPSGPW